MGTRQNRTRKNRVEFYLDDREYTKFCRAVEKSGLNISSYLRHLVNDRVPQDRPPMEYWDVLNEIRIISTTVKQVANIAYVTGVIDAEKYQENHKTLLDLYMKIIDATIMPKKVD